MPRIKPEIDFSKWWVMSVSFRVSCRGVSKINSKSFEVRAGRTWCYCRVLFLWLQPRLFAKFHNNTRDYRDKRPGLVSISIINVAASFWRGNIYRCSWFAFKDVLFVKNNSDVFAEFRLYAFFFQFAWQFFLYRKCNVRSCGKHGTPLHANLSNITFHDKIHVSSQQGAFVRSLPRLYIHGLGELFTIFPGKLVLTLLCVKKVNFTLYSFLIPCCVQTFVWK